VHAQASPALLFSGIEIEADVFRRHDLALCTVSIDDTPSEEPA